jgi:hypothetical protein
MLTFDDEELLAKEPPDLMLLQWRKNKLCGEIGSYLSGHHPLTVDETNHLKQLIALVDRYDERLSPFFARLQQIWENSRPSKRGQNYGN